MIVSEIGVNHFGKSKLSNIYVDSLIRSKVEAITFQVPNDEYFKIAKFNPLNDENYIRNIKKIKKSKKKIGIAICDEKKISFFVKLGIDFWKVLSRDFYNKKLILKLIKTKKKIYVSTGFSSYNDIKKLSQKYKKLNFIHTALSHEINDVNLNVIERMKKITKKENISFGLHAKNHNVLLLSTMFNPVSLFFYVKLDKKFKYPDNEHAISINKVDYYINNILELRKARGSGFKKKVKLKKKIDFGKIK